MANAGSIVASLIVNADQMMAGFNAGTEAAKKASNSIGGSIDRINSKQINQAATSILKNMLGPVALVSAGTQMATDLVKGFSSGSIKTWEDAGRGLMESLNKGLQSIPIVGEFAKLGEAIGNAAFGVDKATASIAETAVQVEKIQTLINSLKADADLVTASKEKIIQRTEDLNRTAAEKELNQIEKDLKVKKDLAIKAALAIFDATNKINEQQFKTVVISEGVNSMRPEMAGMEGGSGPVTRQEVNPEYDKAIIAQQEKRNRAEKQIRDDLNKGYENQIQDIKDLQTAEQTAIDAKESAQAEWDEMLQWGVDMQKEIIADEETRIKLIKERTSAEEKANDVLYKANLKFVDTAETLKKQTENQTTTTGLSTAIGNVKVAGANDFSVQKQLDVAKQTLEEARRQSEILRNISSKTQPSGGVT